MFNQDQQNLEETEEENENKQINKNEIDEQESVVISRAKLALTQRLIKNVKENSEQLLNLLKSFNLDDNQIRIDFGQLGEVKKAPPVNEVGGKIIEGVFNGENMIGPDGKQYSVPANYASKSKMVEGDILKLTITEAGTFMYKQIGPIDRIRIVGALDQNKDGSYVVRSGGKKWRILSASVTFYKGEVGDEVVLLIPKTGESQWGAVENIIKAKIS